MIFATIPLDRAEGAVLGHSLTAGRLRLKKGHRLGAAEIEALRAAGQSEVLAAVLEPGDVPEDQAAQALALACQGEGTRVAAAFTGRCNLYAEAAGVLVVDNAAIDRINEVDEAITIATLPAYDLVEPGQMLATVKIIPYAAPGAALARCIAVAREAAPVLKVAALRARKVGLAITRLPGTKQSVVDKTLAVTRDRVEALGSHIEAWLECGHEERQVADAVSALLARGCEPVLVFGASATVDRRDAVPAGIVLAGGAIDYFGMPVDPGNLLLMGHRGAVPVIGLPTCSRSPKVNGFDWVLQRILAGLPVGRREIARMGTGGLLKEIATRPQPRDNEADSGSYAPRLPRIAGLVLAAGRASRMGRNKLLEPVDGKPMVESVVDALLSSAARPILVVTGHYDQPVRAALAGKPVAFVHNPDYSDGLSTSVRAGIAALPAGLDGALVCLGDMPRIKGRDLDKLIAAFDPREGRSIIVPTFEGRRGNPILWAARFFPAMQQLTGDVGARSLVRDHADEVREVPMEDDGVLLDIDTPAALAGLAAAS